MEERGRSLQMVCGRFTKQGNIGSLSWMQNMSSFLHPPTSILNIYTEAFKVLVVSHLLRRWSSHHVALSRLHP